MYRSSSDRGGGMGVLCRDVPVDEEHPASAPSPSGDIAARFAVRLGSHGPKLILASLHPGQSFRKPLVLNNRRLGDPLVFIEHAISQSDALPADLEPPVRKLVSLDVLAGQSHAQRRLLQNDPLAVIGERQLLRDIALLAPGQDRVELGWPALQRTMQILRSSGSDSKTLIEARHEGWKVGVRRLERRDPLDPQLLHQPVLQRAVHPFHPPFGLARVRAQDLDPQFTQRSAELGYALTALRLRLRHAKDRVFVGIEGEGPPVARQIALQRLKIRQSALRWGEPKRNQPAGRIVDEDNERAAGAAILEPAVLTAVDLHQLAKLIAAQTRLMQLAPLLARQPEPFLPHL